MTRKLITHPVSIGNGLYARAKRPLSVLEAYRELQRTCGHEKRDARGTCYRCGQTNKEENR